LNISGLINTIIVAKITPKIKSGKPIDALPQIAKLPTTTKQINIITLLNKSTCFSTPLS